MRLGSRAAANVVRGVGGSLPLAVLPSLMSHWLDQDELRAWVLIVQLAAYVSFLELGIQTAMSQSTAQSRATGNLEGEARSISAGLGLLVGATAVGVVLVAVLVAGFPALFDLPTGLSGSARGSLAVLGGCACVALSGSGVHGALVGAGYYWESAVIVAGTRFVSVGTAAALASRGASLQEIAAALGSGMLLSSVLAHGFARRAGIVTRYRRVSADDYRSIGSIILTVGLWSAATLLISGLDVVVVGVVDYAHVAAYALAASLLALLSSGYAMVTTALIPTFAELSARPDDRPAAVALLNRATVVGTSSLGCGIVLLTALREPLLHVWAPQYVADASGILALLAFAQFLRLALSPIPMFLLAFGRHQRTRAPAVTEGLLNLLLSIVLGLWLGSIGVAIATLVAIVSVYPMYRSAMRDSTLARGEIKRLWGRGIYLPSVVTLGSVAVSFATHQTVARSVACAVSVAALGGIVWRYSRRQPAGSTA